MIKPTLVNKNTFVELFHRLLKTVYLQSERIDHLLHALLRIARDMAFGQLIKGKLTHRWCEINKRHQLAINTNDTYKISEGEDNKTYDTRIQVLRFISKEKMSGLRWELNPQPSQLWCDALRVELPSPWEHGGGE